MRFFSFTSMKGDKFQECTWSLRFEKIQHSHFLFSVFSSWILRSRPLGSFKCLSVGADCCRLLMHALLSGLWANMLHMQGWDQHKTNEKFSLTNPPSASAPFKTFLGHKSRSQADIRKDLAESIGTPNEGTRPSVLTYLFTLHFCLPVLFFSLPLVSCPFNVHVSCKPRRNLHRRNGEQDIHTSMVVLLSHLQSMQKELHDRKQEAFGPRIFLEPPW